MTTKQIIIIIFSCILCLLLGGVIGWLLNNKKVPQKQEKEVIVKYDTIEVTKTIDHTKYVYDTIVVWDTIVKDSVVYVKDEPKVYSDSTADYRLDITATKLYDYKLDIYEKETTIIPPENKVKWGQSVVIGISGGYGVSITQQPAFSPFIGISVTYGFGITW